jgi:hypothetical protein
MWSKWLRPSHHTRLSSTQDADLKGLGMDRSEAIQDADVLEPLQQAILRAVLLGLPLPGGQSLTLPDSTFLADQPELFISDENLVASVPSEGASKRVRVASSSDIARTAVEQERDIAYLRFQPAERNGDEIRIAIEARLAPPSPHTKVLGLSGALVTFRRKAGSWIVTDEPVQVAM